MSVELLPEHLRHRVAADGDCLLFVGSGGGDMRYVDLAVKYGVTHSTVGKIVRTDTFRCVGVAV